MRAELRIPGNAVHVSLSVPMTKGFVREVAVPRIHAFLCFLQTILPKLIVSAAPYMRVHAWVGCLSGRLLEVLRSLHVKLTMIRSTFRTVALLAVQARV